MARLTAASARRDITPDRSVQMAGMGPTERASTGVHDPLYARAAVVSDGESTLGIAAVDLLWLPGPLVGEVRKRAPVDELIATATHTHSGPYLPIPVEDIVDFHPDELGFTREAVADVVDYVTEALVETLDAAAASLSPATLRAGQTEASGPQLNRRARGGLMGEVDGVEDRDPDDVDPDLTVLEVVPEGGDRIVVYNYPLHTTTMGGTAFSADWPRVVADRIADDGGETLFLNGAAGDIVPRNSYTWRNQYDSAAAFSEAIGADVADAVEDALRDAAARGAVADPSLSLASRDLEVPLRTVDRDALERRRAELIAEIDAADLAIENPLSDHPLARERLYVDQQLAVDAWADDTLPAYLVGARLGPVSTVTLPGEPFVQHGRELKAASAAPLPAVVGYANGMLGYLPTVDAYERGGYEVGTARIGPDGVRCLRRTADELLF